MWKLQICSLKKIKYIKNKCIASFEFRLFFCIANVIIPYVKKDVGPSLFIHNSYMINTVSRAFRVATGTTKTRIKSMLKLLLCIQMKYLYNYYKTNDVVLVILSIPGALQHFYTY